MGAHSWCRRRLQGRDFRQAAPMRPAGSRRMGDSIGGTLVATRRVPRNAIRSTPPQWSKCIVGRCTPPGRDPVMATGVKRATQDRRRPSVDYRTLAELRYHIRRFLRMGESTARAAGVQPEQYQLLLQLEGLEGRDRQGNLEASPRLERVTVRVASLSSRRSGRACRRGAPARRTRATDTRDRTGRCR